jgi:hypothetical protein
MYIRGRLYKRVKWYLTPLSDWRKISPPFQVQILSPSLFWMADDIEEGDFIGFSDETLVVGLFSELAKDQRHSPLLHFGNLIGLFPALFPAIMPLN